MQLPSRNDIDVLIQLFAKLPGLGPRSARRAVLQLLTERDRVLKPLLQTLERTAESVRICHICANLDIADPCHICTDQKREQSIICVVEEVSDLWAMERSGLYKGTYHVLGGTLSALDGRGPQALRLSSLQTRVEKGDVQEVILATNATVDGQTTAHYITNLLKETGVKLSRLAQGIPIGGELDYLDDGTLGAALKARLLY